MQYRPHDSLPSSFNMLSGEKTSSSRLADHILNIFRLDDHQLPNDMIRPTISDSAVKYLNFTPQIDTKQGITKLVSWYMQQHQFHKKHEEVFHSCNGESHCYRDQVLLPCASECSYSSMCEATGFDEAISISQRLTQKCPYVLYTSSFGPNVKAIDIKAPTSSSDYDKDKEFCKIAFVSKNSDLVRTNQGKNVHKGWNLIPVDWENDTARFQDKKWLPKLSPKKLFHQSVHYAIYLQDDLTKTPSLEDMLFIISLMNWKRQDFNGNIQQSKEAMILLSALEKNSTPLRKDQIDRSTFIQQSESPKVMTMSEAREKILEYRGINHPKGKQDLQKRITLSQQTTLLLNRCEFSTSCQNNIMYKYALRYWVKTKWVVHDLHSIDAKDFRCDWYREHIKLNDDFDEFSFAHVMAIKEIEHFLSLDDKENDDGETDTRAQMLERVMNGDLERWISLGTKQDIHENKKLYVHIVDTEKLVDGRIRWNQERLIQEVKASK